MNAIQHQTLAYGAARELVMQRMARELGKEVRDLTPWVDYDPIATEYRIQSVKSGKEGVCYSSLGD